MKHIKSYILLTWMAVSLVGCKVDDLKDDVNDLKNRVALIEEQVRILNDNVEVMAYVLDPQQKTIRSVTENNGQYVITLSDGYTMTLNVGKAGSIVQPAISVENGCWVVNGLSTGVKAVGENGKDGDGYPEFQVQNGKWQVRFGDGEWTDVNGGDLGTGTSLGDQFFESASLSEDGTVFTIHTRRGNSPERAASASNSLRRAAGTTTDSTPPSANNRTAWRNKSAKGSVSALRAIVLAAVLLFNVPA